MGLKFRRGSTAQQSGSLAFGEPYVNTTLGTLVVGGATGDIVLSAGGTGSTGNFGAISGSGLDITGNANIAGNLSVGGQLTIGDNTSDTINVVASLSSSLIPQTTNVFDLGSASKIWRDLYISTGSIKFVDGTTVVKELTLATITGLESATGSSNVSITNLNTTTASLNTSVSNLNTFSSSALTRLTALEVETSNLETFSGSALTRLTALEVETSNLESFSGSQLTQNSALATITGSLISSASNLTQRVAANEAVSGTFARTNSTNTFNGTQTVSGSLYVTQDLVVGGSSSIQNISSSNLIIGAAYVTLNTATPSSRYAGLQIIDSGSSGGSGSFLYDAVQDEFIFIHRGNGTNITSSHFVLGPETYDNLGNETYLTNNRLSKGTGKEHLVDSNITDDGTTISLGSNINVTGSIVVSGMVDGVDVSILNSNINTFSSSALTRLTALEVETSNLESFSSSALTRLSNLEGTDITITLTGDVTGTGTITNLGNVSFATTVAANQVALGTDTTGDYVASLVQGTGVTITNNSGESATPTIAIGQAVATSDNVRFASIGVGMAASGTSGRIDAANDVVAFSTSDIRLKENIKPIENALDKISKISGNTYDWKSELKDVHGYDGSDVGVIAQEIEAVLPELVQDRDNGYKAVKYDKIVALLIEGIKEQQTQIHSLTLEIEKLKEQKGL